MNKCKYDDLLEILLITYNRSTALERTLEFFIKSPFSNCKITILDNCSTDDTPLVCKKFQKKFRKFNIVRHRVNIGFGANYLRAAELSESEYSWIICDDDIYNFSYCDDIIKTIEEGTHDVLSVGGGDYIFSKRGISTTAIELINQKEMYYTIHSFVPVTIYRTSLFDSDVFVDSYFAISDIFPQFVFINKSVNTNCKIYISRELIIKRAPDNSTSNLNPFYQFACWVNNTQQIINKDKKIRKRVIYENFNHSKLLFISKLAYYIIFEKVYKNQNRFTQGKEGFLKKWIILYNAFTEEQFIFLILVTPIFLIPSIILKPFLMLAYIIYYKGSIPSDKKFNQKIDPRK